ncbi:hypothetical protein OROGR_032062 [Orobanche gracilis]
MSDSLPTQPPPVAFLDEGTATPTTQQLSPYIAAASSSHSSSSTASSIVIVIIIIASAVVVTASIYILLRFLSKRFHRSFRTFAAADDVVLNRDSSNNPNFRYHQQEQQQCLAEPSSLLDKLPLFTFASVTGNLTGGDCSVCLSKFEPHDQLRLLPFCCHAFHAACIDTWIVSNQTCPLCRSTVIPSDSEILDKVVSDGHSRGISSNSFRNGNMGSFRIEIGSISRRRDRAAVAADGEPRSYSIGSFDYILDGNGYEVSVGSTDQYRRGIPECTSVDKESSVGITMLDPPGEILAAEVSGGGRNWLREYVDRLASVSMSSRAMSFRSSGRLFSGSSRRTDVVAFEDLEANRVGEEISELFRWLSGV